VDSLGAPNTSALPTNRPKSQTTPLIGGIPHDPAAIAINYYTDALDKLDKINDVNMIVTPGCEIDGVQPKVEEHCFKMYDRFAILDSKHGVDIENIEIQRSGIESPKGFAALYYPWIEVVSEKTGKRITVPPSGHVAGIYARTDLNRGVHKAPAGTEAVINGALGVEKLLTDADQSVINLKGINVIRVFQQGGRPIVWGARTTSSDTNWQYVNIRRLFLFLEESIQQGIRGSVFEPNNLALWGKLKRTIRAFLMTQWRDGALFGKTAEEAFYIRIDEVLNPFSEQALGRLTIEIGVRPSYPAEFIVVRIGIWQGGSDVSEV
jgi:phage tail sheath protein FI